MSDLQPVIGLEVHAQLRTRTKLFCDCLVDYGGPANSRVCPVCLGLPGALPVANREAARLAARFALALGADLSRVSGWARKNYFYPDLPKGYQITQHRRPLARRGTLRIEAPEAAPRAIRIDQIHLEEDAGKSVHDGFGEDQSGIDYNRCGVPLIEIVSAPELHTPDEAHRYLERLRSVLRATGVCEAQLQLGTLRCDANVSLHRPDSPLGTRVEIKNLNSLRHVRRALEYEIERQSALIAAGGAVARETRLWDEAAGATELMRSKEDADDYRYFPEPDLGDLVLAQGLLHAAGEAMPEPLHARMGRFIEHYGLRGADAERLAVDHELADYYETAVREGAPPTLAAHWTLGEVQRCLADRDLTISECPVSAARLAELLTLVETETISQSAAREVFRAMEDTVENAPELIDRLGLRQVSAEAELTALADAVLADHTAEVAAYRDGKTALHGFFVGELMRRSGGRAHPQRAAAILRERLDGREP